MKWTVFTVACLGGTVSAAISLPCGLHQTSDAFGNCVCEETFASCPATVSCRPLVSSILPSSRDLQCFECPAGYVRSSDSSLCLRCEQSDCSCAEKEFLIEFAPDGSRHVLPDGDFAAICSSCVDGASFGRCASCTGVGRASVAGTCACDSAQYEEIDGVCVPRAFSVHLQHSTSQWACFAHCRPGNFTACSCTRNLCSTEDFSATACAAVAATAESVLAAWRASASETRDSLDFRVAAFAFTGEFLGFSSGISSLCVCDSDLTASASASAIATFATCRVPLDSLRQHYARSPVFFEVWRPDGSLASPARISLASITESGALRVATRVALTDAGLVVAQYATFGASDANADVRCDLPLLRPRLLERTSAAAAAAAAEPSDGSAGGGLLAGIIVAAVLGVAVGLRKFSVKSGGVSVYASDLFGSPTRHVLHEVLKSVGFFHGWLLCIVAAVFAGTASQATDVQFLDGGEQAFLVYVGCLALLLLTLDLATKRPWFVLIDWEISGAGAIAGSAWRSLFVANELYERASVTRIHRLYLWVFTTVALEGLGTTQTAAWASAAWATSVAVSAGVAVAVVVGTRLVEIFRGSEILNFVDVLSLANISLAIVQSPDRVRYVHGKAPSGKGDWSSEELERKLQDEANGLLVKRGLFPEDPTRRGDWQSFLLVNQEHGFQEKLLALIRDLENSVKQLHSGGAKTQDLKKELSTLITRQIEGTTNIRAQTFPEHCHFACPPESNLLFEDPSGLAWTDALLYGQAFLGFPVGEEFRLLTLEIACFAILVRFQGSVFLAAAVAFAASYLYLGLRSHICKGLVARTAGIDQRFLL